MTAFVKLAWISGVALLSGTSFAAGRAWFYYHQSIIAKSETLEQLRIKDQEFRSKLQDGDIVSVGQFPMPGATMLWLTPSNHNQWRQKFEDLQRISHPRIKAESLSDLKRWCQIQKTVTQVRIVKNQDTNVKIKMSLDSNREYTHLSESTDFTDLKQYCSRPVTNKEWFGTGFRNSSSIKIPKSGLYVQESTCEQLAQQPYSSNNHLRVSLCLREGTPTIER